MEAWLNDWTASSGSTNQFFFSGRTRLQPATNLQTIQTVRRPNIERILCDAIWSLPYCIEFIAVMLRSVQERLTLKAFERTDLQKRGLTGTGGQERALLSSSASISRTLCASQPQSLHRAWRRAFSVLDFDHLQSNIVAPSGKRPGKHQIIKAK